MRTFICLVVVMVACNQVQDQVAELAAASTGEEQTCNFLFDCPDVGCPFAPGPAPNPTDGAGLWCLVIRAGNPCFCVPQGPGVDTWCIPTQQQIGGANGYPCTADSQCGSGFCRDSKCCNSDCGGGGPSGNLGDCQACSIAHYGQADGQCTTITDTDYTCRLYSSQGGAGALGCDLSEKCTGTSTTCPADVGRRQGQVCNTTTGAVCPANSAAGAPHVCPI